MNRIFGTKEWAEHNQNCCLGCRNNCKYCYARYNATQRWKKIKPGEWINEKINLNALNKKFGKRKGTTMFPTTHDITPGNIEACLTVLENLLKPGNNVLIVSKPRIECIKKLCINLRPYKSQILFRFTIGASDDKILKYWEPGAPDYYERFLSLKHAFQMGYDTSVSMEPVLDWPNLIENVEKLKPYITDSIWIGTMNYIEKRVEINNEEDKNMVNDLVKHHNLENYQKIYDTFKDDPEIKWKESMKKALGLKMPEEIGLDI